jgi:hypothetical protein
MKRLNRTQWICGGVVLAGALLLNTAPATAQDYGDAGGYNYAPAGQVDSLVSRIALYPDPLLAQIFAAAAFPDQIAAAAQGYGGPFDPSVEALMQYPSVLQMMAADPAWTQALGQTVMQNEGAVMDAIQNLRREAQQYGYLQSGPQMQVVDDGGYIGIQPVGGYMYVPTYDPYVVFARPRAGFFVGGAIRFGGGFRWSGGYDRFDWRRHELYVNRRVWTPPVRRYEAPRNGFEQRRFEGNRGNFGGGNREWNRNSAAPQNRNYAAPPMQAPAQRGFAGPQSRGDFGRQNEQRNFAPSQQQPQQREFAAPQSRGDFGRQRQQNFNSAPAMQQRNFAAPRQNEQRNFAAPQQQRQQREFAAPQSRGDFGRQRQQNFNAPAMQQRNFGAPRQMEQRNSAPQPQNREDSRHGGEGHGHRR